MSQERRPQEDYEASLRRYGMRAEHFMEALGASNTERLMCVHGHSARSGPGYYAYNGMLSSLSRQMCDGDEWEREDRLSMPLLVNRSRRLVLTVSSGDEYTGLVGYRQKPKTKNPKGELTRELARLNEAANQDTGLFGAGVLELQDPQARSLRELVSDLDEYTFWLVLVYFDRDKLEIRCEVSQPKLFNSGRVNDYYNRIVLPSYSLTEEDFPTEEDPNDDFGPSTDFDLPRR